MSLFDDEYDPNYRDNLEFDPSDAYDDPIIEEEEEDNNSICPICSGSGEGMYDGSTCSSCKGSGSSKPIPKNHRWF